EKNPAAAGETVNDVFRYFHNLKGNSGIIGYRELNGLTHEAETLLNRVRKGEMATSNAMIDLLLGVVDMIETLIGAIDMSASQVTPCDTSALVARLQAAVESGEVAPTGEADTPGRAAPPAAPQAPPPAEAPQDGPEVDVEDLKVFGETVGQQLANISLALETLERDPGQKDYVDGLYRSLVSVQNSAQFMGLDDIKINAERTAGLVAQARDADLDFALMVDILRQECAIISDLVARELERLGGDEPVEEELVSAMDEDAPAPSPPAPPAPPAGEGRPAPAPDEDEDEASTVVQAPAPVRSAAGPRGTDRTPAARPAPPRPEAEASAAPAAGAAAAAGKKPKVSSTIRVDHEKLDHLMNLIGELIINRNRFAMLARSLETGGQHIDVSEVASSLTETTYAMARISDDLQDTIMKVRMVPVSTVFSRFPRLVRDLSRKSGKKVELIMEGEETELDKSVIEEIGDPLVHMIRNSVDHGLEANEDRDAAGKPETGRVWLRAYHQGNSVAIEVEDDGRGIDPAKMREVGVKKGMVTPEEAKALDDQQAIGLIFEPGFSGAEKVTDISGRGVGMDVVKTNIKNLKGSVNINTEVGRGTRFTIALPLTLAIIDALMVKVAGDTYALPLEAVSETTKIEVRRFTEVNGRKAVTLRGEVLGIMDLCEILELPANSEKRDIVPIVVIQDNNRRLGLVVDTLLERQEIVIKPLGDYLGNKEGISGATIMGDGSVVLILDPHEIYRMSTSRVGSGM
ncbi:chemotaxis protein CheA, partial [Desulfocurvus sp.]|uniref:chemotaxis protein CheW n=1 Tax=Desulfocurvus sp. TaxID=2871698 RepID=UPI0025C03554